MTENRHNPRLTDQEIEHYKNEGYALPQGKVFSDEKFAALVEHFEGKLAAWPKDQRPEAMDTPHFGDPKLNEWALASIGNGVKQLRYQVSSHTCGTCD